jgi:hypothetical protein
LECKKFQYIGRNKIAIVVIDRQVIK